MPRLKRPTPLYRAVERKNVIEATRFLDRLKCESPQFYDTLDWAESLALAKRQNDTPTIELLKAHRATAFVAKEERKSLFMTRLRAVCVADGNRDDVKQLLGAYDRAFLESTVPDLVKSLAESFAGDEKNTGTERSLPIAHCAVSPAPTDDRNGDDVPRDGDEFGSKKYLTVDMGDDHRRLLGGWRDGDIVVRFGASSCRIQRNDAKQLEVTALAHAMALHWWQSPETDWFRAAPRLAKAGHHASPRSCSFSITLECGFGCLPESFECRELFLLVRRSATSTRVIRAKLRVDGVAKPICWAASIRSNRTWASRDDTKLASPEFQKPDPSRGASSSGNRVFEAAAAAAVPAAPADASLRTEAGLRQDETTTRVVSPDEFVTTECESMRVVPSVRCVRTHAQT